MDGPWSKPADELIDASGRPRPAWRTLLRILLGPGLAALRERRAELDHASRQAGAGWRCDPIPFLLPEAEFTVLEAGLAQRARLLDAVLADLYGPCRLIGSGLLPPALVFGNPHFLHPCRFMPQRLGVYAADLLRRPDGEWCVLADHTAAPLGLARAIENRRRMARALPEPFRGIGVAQLRPFFERWQEILLDVAPPADPPGIALLAPGHAHPARLDATLLAGELGCTLVEAGDLTVCDGALWLRTLRGRQALRGLISLVAGHTIDPLELPAETGAGVPGLLSAIRGGSVSVLNGPGAALAEAPALAAFLPLICRRLLGEPLGLPGVETLWLGDPDAACLAQAGGFAIAPAFGEATHGGPYPPPWAQIATAPPPPSLAPGLGESGALEPMKVRLRLFLLRDGETWRALPGGLALIAPPIGDGARSPPLCKDVWVMIEQEPSLGLHHAPSAPLAVRRSIGDLPSRVADNFYWFGRYLERLETASRLARAILARLTRASLLPHDLAEASVLAACVADAGLAGPELTAAAGPDILAEGLAGMLARENAALAGLVGRVHGLADTLRDRLSGDMWAAVARGLHALDASRRDIAAGHRTGAAPLADFTERVLEFCATVSGFAAENMVRGGGHLFLDLGRRIERAQALARALARLLDQPPERLEAALSLALELCDSTLTYRARYPGLVQPAPVLDLVLADESNPRSLGFQLATARARLTELGIAGTAALAARLDAPEATVRRIATGMDAPAMPAGLRSIAAAMAALSDAVSEQFFSLSAMTCNGQPA